MRIRPAAILILLAACSRPDDAGRAAAKADGAPVTAPGKGQPVRAAGDDLPDAANPRLFLDMESSAWAQWDSSAPDTREARLRAVGLALIRADSTGPREPQDTAGMGSYDPYGEVARDYHLVDFSGDGVKDVIYSGPWYFRNENGFGAGEGTQIRMYQVMSGRAVQVMEHHGDIQRIFPGAPGQPLSFRAVQHGCCADPAWSIDYFRPVRAGDTVRFHPYHRVVGREGIEIPARFMAAPRRFTVANDRYLLREAPRVDTATSVETEWFRWEGHGNAVAEYGRGARGIALAEQTDATGRVWWFVRMDGRTPPLDAQFSELNNEEGVRMDRVGWMSSRFVQAEP